MTQTVTVSRDIRCPVDDASAFITDMHALVPAVTSFKRCEFIEDSDEGQVWDVFLQSGTIYLGGRVVASSGPRELSWHSVRGTRHEFEARVEDAPAGSRISLSLSFSLGGLGVAWFSEFIGRGIVSRTLSAAAEEIRHHLEFEREGAG